MSYEVECGECGEQILIEDLDVEVACPHCETVLILNAEDIADDAQQDATESEFDEEEDEQVAFGFHFTDNSGAEQEENGSDSGVASAILTKEEAENIEAETASEEANASVDAPSFDFLNQAASQTEEAEEAPEEPTEDQITSAETASVEETPNFNFGETPAEELAEAPAFSLDPSASPDSREADEDGKAQAAESETEQNEEPVAEENAVETTDQEMTAEPVAAKPITETGGYSRRSRGPSPKVFQILVSYSILLTIAFLYLFLSFFQAKPHQLESLPDIAPPEEGEFRLIRENANLAPGHTLQIGETQRFGNIELTPLGVVRGSLKFEHFQGLPGGNVPPTRPVYKLKLKIKNVSQDQVFPPLDTELLALREHDPDNYDRVYANNWVCKVSDLGNRENRVLMFNHPPTSEFDIKGFVARPLNPGEEVETFLPTVEEGLNSLEGDLVWRFQIRKGFHPVTMNGVTTLVEVEFSANSITKETT